MISSPSIKQDLTDLELIEKAEKSKGKEVPTREYFQNVNRQLFASLVSLNRPSLFIKEMPCNTEVKSGPDSGIDDHGLAQATAERGLDES